MTVKKLTAAQKDAIVTVYDSKTRNIKQIAEFLGVSTRTIGRVLDERGVASPMETRTAEAKKVMVLLYQHKVTPAQLEHLLENYPLVVRYSNKQQQAMQTIHSRKSPKAHNDKQIMLPLPTFESYEFQENLTP